MSEMRETPKAAAAFLAYCALGTSRSLRKLADESGTKLSQLGEWSVKYDWQERIKLYDAERALERQRKRDEEIERMQERHAQIGITQQARALEQIKALIEAKKFGSQAAVQLLKLATDLERLARGLPTERKELTGADGEPLASGAQVIFYLPKVEPEEGYNG